MKHSIIAPWSVLIAGLLLAFSATVAVAGGAAYAKQKVVYHVNYDDPGTQKAALGNIQNHINAVGAENLDLKVVMHGNGVSLVMLPTAVGKVSDKMKLGNATDQQQAKIDGLKAQNVEFKICANTLKGRKINYEDHLYMVEEADIVPSGVAELAHLQAQGYTYIKP